ncbi:hypothetical protein [Phormidesmis priestleyi]|uniref:hypothetical protein n=1 Tax=Phormidesmis priestleyi TaxID=268141 RepID=UPI00083B201E|nr:hypothetical protein [Phormidesmis priestleyi]
METQPLDPAIAHIQLLSQQLDDLYQAMKTERQAIAQWEEDQDFSILGVLELFSGDVQGYVEKILTPSASSHPEEHLAHLRKLNVFEINYFATWYFANLNTYPHIKQYTEHLDHLRLLLMEHFGVRFAIAA